MGLFVMSKRRVGVPIPETIAVCTASFRCCRKDCISQLVHGRVWLALFQCDHYPICADAEGPAPPWNLVPRLIRAHRRKTAKRDLPEVAKIRRVTSAEAEFGARLLAKDRGEPRRESRWPKRSFAKRRTKNESQQDRETS
jgi:hypothetical protein